MSEIREEFIKHLDVELRDRKHIAILLTHYFDEAVDEESEACEKLADDMSKGGITPSYGSANGSIMGSMIAKEIKHRRLNRQGRVS